MNLYEIEQALLDTINYNVDVETGEMLEGANLEEAIDKWEVEMDKKIENCVLYLKNNKADAEALKAEKMNLAKRQKVAENKVERMQKYIDRFFRNQYTNEEGEVDIANLNKAKFETPRCKVSYAKSTKVKIDNLDKVPSEFIKPHELSESDVNKTDLKKYLKDNEDCAFASLDTNVGIRIK